MSWRRCTWREIQNSPARVSETGALSAGRLAREAGAKKLVINHQSVSLDPPEQTAEGIHEVKSAYDGPVVWARDMMVVDW